MTEADQQLSDPTNAVVDGTTATDIEAALAAARFRRLFDDHFRTVIGYALRRCANPSDAADVAADVFLTAWRRLDDLPRDDPLPWLIGTARGAVANQRRGQLRRHRLADRLRDDLLVNPPVAQAHADLAPVTAAMERLSRSDRELLRLVAWEGLTPIQIAALDDVPASTVRSRLRRARTRLASALAAERNRPSPITAAAAAHPAASPVRAATTSQNVSSPARTSDE